MVQSALDEWRGPTYGQAYAGPISPCVRSIFEHFIVFLYTRTHTHASTHACMHVSTFDPQVISVTESWTNKNIVDAELALTGNV